MKRMMIWKTKMKKKMTIRIRLDKKERIESKHHDKKNRSLLIKASTSTIRIKGFKLHPIPLRH